VPYAIAPPASGGMPLDSARVFQRSIKRMSKNSSRTAGRHFLQIPGPTPLPDRILRAMDTPIIDHRGPEFHKLARRVLDGIKTIFKTTNPVIIYTATGTGAWEGGAGQHLIGRRSRADGRDRPVCHPVEKHGG